jgi:4-aminobutyrate aminotransferase-like enzyme
MLTFFSFSTFGFLFPFILMKITQICKVVYFTNSGTEANELALMMARLYTGYHDIISIRNGYHGNATSTMGATSQFYHKFNVVQVTVFLLYNRMLFCCDNSSCLNPL